MAGAIRGEMDLMSIAGSGQTIGTSTTTLLTVPGPATGGILRLDALLKGGDGTDAVTLSRAATIKNVADVVSVAGAAELLASLGNAALTGASCAFVVSGSSVELRVTGVLTKTINWTAECLVR